MPLDPLPFLSLFFSLSLSTPVFIIFVITSRSLCLE